MGTLRIGRTGHETEEVFLSAHPHDLDVGPSLEVNLFADSSDLSKAGFAINCLTLPGLQRVEDLQGKSFTFGPDQDDELNDLGESVFCRQGKVLEIDRLALAFGRAAAGGIPIKVEAVCHAEGHFDIPVSGSFVARVKGQA